MGHGFDAYMDEVQAESYRDSLEREYQSREQNIQLVADWARQVRRVRLGRRPRPTWDPKKVAVRKRTKVKKA
jgi:hypothetical protein